MPLDLKDPRWSELPGSYGHSDDVVKWLTEARQRGSLTGERLGDLVNEVAHQGDASRALYAVVPHFVDLARGAAAKESVDLLVHAGLLCVDATRGRAQRCPDFLLAEYRAAAKEGATRLAPLLARPQEFDDFKFVVAAIAGFTGNGEFARVLEALDLHEGKLHHPWFERPMSPDE